MSNTLGNVSPNAQFTASLPDAPSYYGAEQQGWLQYHQIAHHTEPRSEEHDPKHPGSEHPIYRRFQENVLKTVRPGRSAWEKRRLLEDALTKHLKDYPPGSLTGRELLQFGGLPPGLELGRGGNGTPHALGTVIQRVQNPQGGVTRSNNRTAVVFNVPWNGVPTPYLAFVNALNASTEVRLENKILQNIGRLPTGFYTATFFLDLLTAARSPAGLGYTAPFLSSLLAHSAKTLPEGSLVTWGSAADHGGLSGLLVS